MPSARAGRNRLLPDLAKSALLTDQFKDEGGYYFDNTGGLLIYGIGYRLNAGTNVCYVDGHADRLRYPAPMTGAFWDD